MQVIRIVVYYTAALFQGLALILIPAASTIFKSPEQNAISDIQYGFLSLPMILSGVFSTLFLKQIINFSGRRKVFFFSCLAYIAYMLCDSATYFTIGDAQTSFLLLLTGNLMLGFGFGLLTSILNIYTTEVKPEKSDALLTGLHSCIGIGAALSPLLVSITHNIVSWQLGGLLCACLFVLVIIISPFLLPADKKAADRLIVMDNDRSAHGWLPPLAFAFLFLIVVYGVAETVISFWTVDYLNLEKKLELDTSLQALSIFWIMVTAGRIFASLITLMIDGWYIYLVSPILIFLSISLLIPAERAVILPIYYLLGFGCSYFFPLSISLASRAYPPWQEKLSGLSVAALMGGIGIGNFFVGYLKNQNYITLREAFESGAILALVIFVGAIFLFFKIGKPSKRLADK